MLLMNTTKLMSVRGRDLPLVLLLPMAEAEEVEGVVMGAVLMLHGLALTGGLALTARDIDYALQIAITSMVRMKHVSAAQMNAQMSGIIAAGIP